MTTPDVRIFDSNSMEWGRDARFPAIEAKVLEGRATHPAASVALVRLAPQGAIQTHTHPVETETALVTAGRAEFFYRDQQALLTAGMGVTIPPGTPHSLRNAGDDNCELLAIHTPPTR